MELGPLAVRVFCAAWVSVLIATLIGLLVQNYRRGMACQLKQWCRFPWTIWKLFRPEDSILEQKLQEMEEEERLSRSLKWPRKTLLLFCLASAYILIANHWYLIWRPVDLECSMCTMACERNCLPAFLNQAEVEAMRLAATERVRLNCTSETDPESELSKAFSRPKSFASRFFGHSLSVGLCITLMAYALLTTFPTLVTPLALLLLESILAAGMLFSQYMSQNPVDSTNVTPVIFRIVCASIHGTPRSTFLINAVYLALFLAIVMPEDERIEGENGRSRTVRAMVITLQQLEHMLVIQGTAAVFRVLRRTTFEARLEVQSSKYLESTLMAVLSGTCDAVVRLSSSFEIIEPCPKLAHLLLKAGSMESANFASLLGDDSRQVFMDRVNESRSLVQSQHVTMLDSSHGQVFLQLYYTKGETVTGECFYLVGVKEDLESGWKANPLLNMHPMTDMTHLSKFSKRMPENEPSEDQSESSAESMILAVSSPAYSHLPLGEYPMLSWIEPLTEDFQIQKCTLAFQAQFGPLFAGASLQNIIAKTHMREFEKWFQSSCNIVCQMGGAGKQFEVPLSVDRGKTIYQMIARLQVLHDGEPDSKVSELVMISFRDVKLVSCKRKPCQALIKQHRRSSREKKTGVDAFNSVMRETSAELMGRNLRL